jgi:probable HAF family extracellular repeat protein
VKTSRKVVIALAALLLFAPTLYSATWTEIDFPGASSTSISGVNNNGDMVGTYSNPGSSTIHGFADMAGVFTTVDPPGSVFADATGINDSGAIVGTYSTDNQSGHGFLLQGGTYTTIDFPGAKFTWCVGINNAGQIVGFYKDTTFKTVGFLLTGGGTTYFTIDISPGNPTYARGINNNGDIVGIITTGPQSQPSSFLFSSSGVITILRAPTSHSRTQAYAINDDGRVVGYVFDQQHSRGFSYFNGNYLLLNDPNLPPTALVEAHGINNAGSIVGDYIDDASSLHGLLRTP